MMYPDADDVLAAVIDTFERYVVPEVHDEYAASLALTIGQLLRSMRVRVAHEGEALWADNAELRLLLASVGGFVPEERPAGEYPSVPRLQAEAVLLRAALVAVIEAYPDPDHPARVAARTYLEANLRRQEPWLIHAFTGPRR